MPSSWPKFQCHKKREAGICLAALTLTFELRASSSRTEAGSEGITFWQQSRAVSFPGTFSSIIALSCICFVLYVYACPCWERIETGEGCNVICKSSVLFLLLLMSRILFFLTFCTENLVSRFLCQKSGVMFLLFLMSRI